MDTFLVTQVQQLIVQLIQRDIGKLKMTFFPLYNTVVKFVNQSSMHSSYFLPTKMVVHGR